MYTGLTIPEFLRSISDAFDDAILGLKPSADVSQTGDDDSMLDGAMDWDYDDEANDTFQLTMDDSTVLAALQSDLRAAKSAGFRVGCLGKVTGAVIVSVSCRILRLGISEEAMQAWNVRPTDYLVLLLRYPHVYLRLDKITHPKPTWRGASLVQMHVGLCDSYKPSLASALEAFVDTKLTGSESTPKPSLSPLFIGDSLNKLLNERLLTLIRYRYDYGFSWAGAEHFYDNAQGKVAGADRMDYPEHYFTHEEWDSTTPALLSSDHLTSGGPQISLPLLAAQFALRRVARCTDFCLNCYCKIESGFEALKPYVCSRRLCLFQYMSLGMGPSIEWEIHTQPYVVDMLISFTYSRARSGQLDDFPEGLALKVPGFYGQNSPSTPFAAILDSKKMELFLESDMKLKVGDWILVMPRDAKLSHNPPDSLHCRVENIQGMSILLSDPIKPDSQVDSCPSQPSRQYVQIVPYDADFDGLTKDCKRDSIGMLLDTLPDVEAMVSFMDGDQKGSPLKPLALWKSRISPSALYILRWIVASNRSCIMQDNDSEHHVSGMERYMQFRFAQDAPDKEQRFVSEVNNVSKRLNLKYPTLFAWHGSGLHNWHSILREGLHFKKIVHGRACGNGVYMAKAFGTSLGYASRGNTKVNEWPQSKLEIQMAISLNEVVNAPSEFVSSSSCYVVNKLDWIQPRYLFIECRSQTFGQSRAKSKPSAVCPQEPSRAAHGPNGAAVTIPISALSSPRSKNLVAAKRPETENSASTETPAATAAPAHSNWKKTKLKLNVKGPIKKSPKNGSKEGTKKAAEDEQQPEAAATTVDDDDDAASIATLFEDNEVLELDPEDPHDEQAIKAKAQAEFLSKTNFRPGTLDVSSLQLLGPPKYATSTATRALQRCLLETLKVQEREPIHELGWYIDQSLIDNVYQWITELHSFDPALPLARDLKSAGLTSIVLEIRFLPEFPISPPFVRIIRPRFRPFSLGGGGHVTTGGALCMELLTSSGWSPVSSIESVLLQVRMALTNMEPRPARLDSSMRKQDYGVGEAVEAYQRVCRAHGWKIPEDLHKVSW